MNSRALTGQRVAPTMSRAHIEGSRRRAIAKPSATAAGRLASPRLTLLCVGLTLLGCTADSNQVPTQRSQQMIVEPSPPPLDPSVFEPRTTVAEFDLATTDGQEGWRVAGGAATRAGGLLLETARERLNLDGEIRVRQVTAIRLELDSAPGCLAVARWKHEGVVRSARSQAMEDRPDSLEIELPTAQHWVGDADSLSLILRHCAGRVVERIVFEGASERLTAEGSARLLTSPWQVTLNDDSRNAVVVLPGTVRRWVLAEAVDSGRLRFGVGLVGRAPTPATFTVSVGPGPDDAEKTLATIESTALEEPPSGWLDFEIEVADLQAGAEILLATETPQSWRPGVAVPVFANPRIVGRGDEPRLNVVVLSIDTLRADRLSLFGYHRPTSPNIDRRARQSGIAFSSTVAPAGWTLPSHVSMLSGLTAMRHGVNFPTVTPASIPLVAEAFTAAGYTTVAFSAGGYMAPEFGLARGFDSFRSRRPKDSWVETSRSDLTDGIEQFTEWLANPPSEPFFAFFHTYEVHGPYWAREPFFEQFGGDPALIPRGYAVRRRAPADASGRREGRFVVPGAVGRPEGRMDPADPAIVSTLYDSSIAFMDTQVEVLFQTLERQGLLAKTIVVLTSDHGEAFGEHDVTGHGMAYDEVTQVPLIFWLPGASTGRLIEDQAQLVDLVPTLLDLTGVAPAAGATDGVSLRPLWEAGTGIPSRPAWIHAGQYGVGVRLAGRLKYIWHRTPWDYFGAGEEVFDLRTDPDETKDLSASDDALLASARELTRKALEEQLPGVRLNFENRTATGHRLRIASDFNRAHGVTNFGCDAIEWGGGRSIEITLPAGSDCRLVLEHLQTGPLSIDLPAENAEDPTDTSLRLDTGQLPPGTYYRWDESGWGAADTPRAGALAFTAEWRGPSADGLPDEVAMDDDLVDQLRALGYID